MKVHLVVVFAISTLVSNVNCYFHCLRAMDEMKCLNGGTCDGNTGNCTCPPEFTHQNCGVKVSDLCPTPDQDPSFDNPCLNNGICHLQGQCACTLDYYGPVCEFETVTSKCTGPVLTLEFAVPESFGGEVYLQANHSCNFTLIDTVAGYKRYTYNMSLEVDKQADCNNALNVTEEGRDVTYTTEAIVNFVPFLIFTTDLSLHFNCTHKASDVEMGSLLGAVNVDEKKDLQKKEEQKVYAPVRFRFLDESDQKVQQLSVGDKFKLKFYLDSDAVYTSLVLMNCSANNTDTEEPLIFRFLDQGCPTTPGQNVIVHQYGQEKGTFTAEEQTTHTSVELMMRAFKFVKSNRVAFSCSVRICKRGDELQCEIPDCAEGEKLTPVKSDPAAAVAGGDPAPADGAGQDPAPADASSGTADQGAADSGADAAGDPVNKDAGTADTSVPAADNPAGDTTPVRRKKRSVFQTEERTVTGVIEVIEPIITKPKQSEPQKKEKECFRSRDIIIVIIVMSAFVLTLLIACIVLAITVSKTRTRVNTMISESGPSFVIPRAKVIT